jgi:predicted GIY-YIG superfamily endonuclease
MEPGYIYILQCANNEFYVGKTKFPLGRMVAHYFRQGSAFTKKHWPVELVYIIKVKDMTSSERTTRQQLRKFGLEFFMEHIPSDVDMQQLKDNIALVQSVPYGRTLFQLIQTYKELSCR